MADTSLVVRAARNAELLRRLNVAVLCVAVVVYAGVLGIAAFYRVGPLAVFSTCIMLAEMLVFQIVRTLHDHLALVRERHQ
jgi:nitric oxide reductase large subunit